MRFLRAYYRQLASNKLMMGVNLIGLSVTIAVVIVIGLLVQQELTYEQDVPNADNLAVVGVIGVVGNGQRIEWGIVSEPIPIDLTEEVSGINNYCRMTNGWRNEREVVVGDVRFLEKGLTRVDSTFFDVTGIKLAQGDPNTAFTHPNSVVITRDAANRLFGNADPIGRQLNDHLPEPWTITGVIDEMPSPSFLQDVNYLIRWPYEREPNTQWLNNINYTCLVELGDGLGVEDVQAAVDASCERHTGEMIRMIGGSFDITLTPLKEVRLHGFFTTDNIQTNRLNFVLQFLAIGVFLLLIAVLNNINLTTAQSTKRGLFVGISKALGATRAQLVRKLIGESLVTASISTLIGVGLAALLLPHFSTLIDVPLQLSFVKQPELIFELAALAIVLGLLGGLSPAYIISRFTTANVLRGELVRGKKGSAMRAGLVVLQFTVAVGLILSSIVVRNQMNYMRHAEIGFDRENVLVVNLGNWDLMQAYHSLYDEYSNLPFVESAATADQLPIFGGNTSVYHIPGEPIESTVIISTRSIDHNYIDAMKMSLVAGRNFDPNRSLDSTEAVIVNRTASHVLGYGDDPVGKTIEDLAGEDASERNTYHIIGMVEDFHFESLRAEIEPLMLRIYFGFPPWLLFRLQPGTEHQAIQTLERMWPSFAGEVPLQYSFLDERYDALYRSEERLSRLFMLFTGVAIIVACMGLFALSAFAAERRTKEIGIRKVLGASSAQIIQLIGIDFIKLVLIANLIALPLVGWLMSTWLGGFAYRTDLSWWLFVLTAIAAMFLAVLTVSIHALRASQANPVNALRHQ